ncbi:hypothetical protein ACWFOP_22490 [Bacillus mycoides]
MKKEIAIVMKISEETYGKDIETLLMAHQKIENLIGYVIMGTGVPFDRKRIYKLLSTNPNSIIRLFLYVGKRSDFYVTAEIFDINKNLECIDPIVEQYLDNYYYDLQSTSTHLYLTNIRKISPEERLELDHAILAYSKKEDRKDYPLNEWIKKRPSMCYITWNYQNENAIS